jgi:methionyl-tRNA formyltransferase
MRITFLTQDDPLYILPFFQSFFAQDLRDFEITGIFACRSMGSRKRSTLLRELAFLYGVPGFAKLLGLQAWHRMAASLHLGSVLGRSHSLHELATQYHVPYKRIGNPNTMAHFDEIASHKPDILISVACPFILKRPVLELPSSAALNIHHAPLPKYKGMMPTFWQMYHGERSVGITIHTMVEKLDEGSILHQEAVPVIHGESMHDLIRRSKRNGGTAMLNLLRRFAHGEMPAAVEPSGETSYFTFPNSTEIRTFRERGLRAI